MGIRGLETYIRENPNENIAQDINIRDAIEEWKQANDHKSPTIIINLKSFVKILAEIDRNERFIIGGQYDEYVKKITKFFDKLLEWNAKLVFFCRPFLNELDDKTISKAYDHAERNQLKQFKKDQMKMGQWLKCHLDTRFLYNLMQICSNYGEVYTQLNGIEFSIDQYAREHSDEVLAMIQSDTDFLLFDSQYQYWSLTDLDISRYKTKIYSRDILYDRLQLDTQQIQMLAALSRLNAEFINNFVRNIDTEENNGKTIFKLATYVRNLENLGDLERIASDIFGENYTEGQFQQIQHELSRYEMPAPDNLTGRNQNFRDFVEFAKKNLYFAYGLAVETVSTNQALAYIDLRRSDSPQFIKLMITILMKQCGILFKDVEERPQTRTVKIKRNYDENHNDETDEVIIYPPMTMPTLNQMTIEVRNSYTDGFRWSLFAWTLGFDNEFILKVQNSFESKFMRIVQYTLKFLLLNKSITFREADIILLDESKRDSTTINRPVAAAPVFRNPNDVPPFVPRSWRDPNNFAVQPVVVNPFRLYRRPQLIMSNWRERGDPNEPRPHNWSNYSGYARTTLPNRRDPYFLDRAWIQTAHKYTIAFESVCHCLELCGLRNETDLIQFDTVKFHDKMRKDKNGTAAIDDMVGKIKKLRLYC